MDNFLVDVRRFVGKVPFTKDAVSLYFCLIDSKTPLFVKGTIAGALAYFIAPLDAIPDFIIGLGFTDDAGVIATTLATVARHVTDEHRRQAEDFFNT
ncbi:DUF1232 domain-containing protein [filamentous cyanobacterium LEGE 11480]|uniref:DUF1232 domain-containing protein n=1 Tax=Romeriopsis navalis LEGE 11480 TaxID=2777977 RepID=A0A928VTN3_9CYAN|nr:YkvA family protein [Romeriopsis navalis]MBE9032846.1 DUF1232 domain-containing protein [Romeriopsis navalis LEGE 11480]